MAYCNWGHMVSEWLVVKINCLSYFETCEAFTGYWILVYSHGKKYRHPHYRGKIVLTLLCLDSNFLLLLLKESYITQHYSLSISLNKNLCVTFEVFRVSKLLPSSRVVLPWFRKIFLHLYMLQITEILIIYVSHYYLHPDSCASALASSSSTTRKNHTHNTKI